MAVLRSNSIRVCGFALSVALAQPALAADVTVQLDAGSGFSVRNSTGAIERLRVDEATGNLSRNGALFVHTTGTNNTFAGFNAGNTTTTYIGRNSGFGNGALGSNTTGFYNSAVGNSALFSNTTGYENSALGAGALRYNTSGRRNAAVGVSALRSNTTGFHNSAVGWYALRNNTSGSRNAGLGYGALISNDAGYANTGIGFRALNGNTSGNRNAALGFYALGFNTTGTDNAALGSYALRGNSTGTFNTAVGFYALRNSGTGSFNVGVGEHAGRNLNSGSHNIYLANQGAAVESGQIKIGTAGFQTQTTIAGIRGVTTVNANAIPVLIDSAGQLGTTSSSRRVKQDIRDMGDATGRLLELRPVTFRYKPEQTLPRGEVPSEYGLIAEEVAEVFPDLVVYDDEGRPFTVKYHEMAPMLLNEMQKQQHTIAGQQQVIAMLSSRLERIESQSGSDMLCQEDSR